ncbi:MAG: hypothetical protein AAFY88_21840, partial [Acidobacteriota bacterium]
MMSTSPGAAGTKLVVRLPNAIGDLLMTLPGLELLDSSGFDCRLVARPFAHQLLAGTAYDLSSIRSKASERRAFRTSGARWGLTFRSSFSSAWQMRRAGLRPMGFDGQGRRLVLARTFPRPRGRLKVEENYRLAEGIVSFLDRPERANSATPQGPAPTKGEPSAVPLIILRTTDEQRGQARRRLQAAGVRGGFIVANPVADLAKGAGFRVWPHFKAFTSRLRDRGLNVVTCPGPGEEELCRELAPESTHLHDVSIGDRIGDDETPAHTRCLESSSGLPALLVGGPQNDQGNGRG